MAAAPLAQDKTAAAAAHVRNLVHVKRASNDCLSAGANRGEDARLAGEGEDLAGKLCLRHVSVVCTQKLAHKNTVFIVHVRCELVVCFLCSVIFVP